MLWFFDFQKVSDLDTKYNQAQQELNRKTSSLGEDVQMRAVRLRERANSLRQQTQSKMRELNDLETQLPQNEVKIRALSEDIDQLLKRMNESHKVIDARMMHYHTCKN